MTGAVPGFLFSGPGVTYLRVSRPEARRLLPSVASAGRVRPTRALRSLSSSACSALPSLPARSPVRGPAVATSKTRIVALRSTHKRARPALKRPRAARYNNVLTPRPSSIQTGDSALGREWEPPRRGEKKQCKKSGVVRRQEAHDQPLREPRTTQMGKNHRARPSPQTTTLQDTRQFGTTSSSWTAFAFAKIGHMLQRDPASGAPQTLR